MLRLTCLFVLIAVSTAYPTKDDVVARMDPGPRYQYMTGGDGSLHLVDLWLKTSDIEAAARFNPDTDNAYHLFTRQNPTVSQPLLLGNAALVTNSNFDARRRTIVLVHGWLSTPTAGVNTALVPAFLAVEDVNILVVDWSVGAIQINYLTAVINTVTSGQGVARFITWLNSVTGASLSQYHLAGHSLGGHQVGIIGRNLGGAVPYITSLDPAGPAWITNSNRFHAEDGIYTEVLHTNVGALGYIAPLGKVDFYPNGGTNNPGCNGMNCDHDRCYYFFAESLSTGGFTGQRCNTYLNAMTGNCAVDETLQMGGLYPKTGRTGIYYMETNAAPPFSRG